MEHTPSEVPASTGARTARSMPEGTWREPPGFSFPVIHTRAHAALATATQSPPVKVTTITAPIGYGKTVLMSTLHEHYAAHGGRSLWLGLDESDDTIERVINRLEACFLRIDSALEPARALHRGDAPVESRIAALLDAIAMDSTAVTLLVDNLNYCRDETTRALLDALVFRTPSSFRLVLSSTSQAPLDSVRARLEGVLQRFDAADLSFDATGIRALFGPRLCEVLGEAGIDQVMRLTEGWPSAVRLMQIVLRAADDPRSALAGFSGTDQDLAALLNQHLVREFDPRFRAFLLRLSLLNSFDVPQAAVATDDEDAPSHIDRLWRDNLFLIPLDRNRQRYRLHTLFRQYLQGEARHALADDERRSVLRRTAQWCEAAGRTPEAIDYAFLAGALPMAAAMLERIAAPFVRNRGDLSRYLGWVNRLHEAGLSGGLETTYWYVWALVFHRRYERARREVGRLLERVAAARAGGHPPPAIASLQRRIEVIRITIETYIDRLDDAHALATRWLDASPLESVDMPDDPFDVATVACAACIHDVAYGQMDAARRMLALARVNITQSDSDYGSGWVAVIGGLIGLRAGEFAATHQDLLATLSRTRTALGDDGGIQATLMLMAAKSAVEMGRNDEAHEHLLHSLPIAHTHGILDNVAWGLDAAVKLWDGRADGDINLAELRELASGYPPRLAGILSCFIIRRLVRLGRTDEAESEALAAGLFGSDAELLDPAIEATPGLRERAMAARIDLHLARGRIRQATVLVQADQQDARAGTRMARQVELALDEAAIALCSHNAAPAIQHLIRAVGLAARRRCLRPFMDRAELIASLVNDTRPKDWTFPVEEERQFFLEVCAQLPTHPGQALAAESTGLADLPTARELELLGLVEAGFSNQQLADRLNVSVATVKWHLYNLYSKLGVKNRASALARARALNLLTR